MSNSKLNTTFSLKTLFASEEMLRTISKIAYEWYCYIYGINNFECEEYKDIVDCVLLEKPVENFVEICVDNGLDYALGQFCYPRDNGLFAYEDIDGYAELLKAEDMRRCTVCGAAFASSSNHAKYCPDCRKRITRKQAAERMRKRRALITR